jgi:hypothetical protein
MHDAGFIRAELIKSTTSDRVVQVWPFELTWEGHEFLDTVRDEEVWSTILDVLAQKGGSLAFAAIQRIAAQLAANQFLVLSSATRKVRNAPSTPHISKIPGLSSEGGYCASAARSM